MDDELPEDDIVERLRAEIDECKCEHDMPLELMRDAADEIERLREALYERGVECYALRDQIRKLGLVPTGQER